MEQQIANQKFTELYTQESWRPLHTVHSRLASAEAVSWLRSLLSGDDIISCDISLIPRDIIASDLTLGITAGWGTGNVSAGNGEF